MDSKQLFSDDELELTGSLTSGRWNSIGSISTGNGIQSSDNTDNIKITPDTDWTYIPDPQQPGRQTQPSPFDPPDIDPDTSPSEMEEGFREWIKKEVASGNNSSDGDRVADPEKLKKQVERVEKLARRMLEWLAKRNRSDIHMGEFYDDFDLIQEALSKVKAGTPLTEIEMRSLNRVYQDYRNEDSE